MPVSKLLVRRTVDSGVPPLVLHYCAVNDCYSRRPVAYRTVTLVNSLIMGRLTPKEYAYPADQSETGIRLAEWNIGEAMRNITRFEDAGRKIKWVAVRCPAILASSEGLYDRIKRIAEENEFYSLDKLCLEFPQSVLYGKTEEIRKSIIDMKLLGVKTAMSGGAASDCPLSVLTEVPVDIVILDPDATVMINDRGKPGVVHSLVQYIKSMNAGIIADGITDDEQINAFNRLDIFGYVPSPEYAARREYAPGYGDPTGTITDGSSDTPTGRASGTDALAMSLEEAILQKEDDG